MLLNELYDRVAPFEIKNQYGQLTAQFDTDIGPYVVNFKVSNPISNEVKEYINKKFPMTDPNEDPVDTAADNGEFVYTVTFNTLVPRTFGGSYKVFGTEGNQFLIFSTVISIIKKVISEHFVLELNFEAYERNRQSLYDRMITKLINQISYKNTSTRRGKYTLVHQNLISS